MINDLDADTSGIISFAEFLCRVVRRNRAHDLGIFEFWTAFSEHDKDDTGVILLDDVWYILYENFHEKLSDTEKVELEADLRSGCDTKIETHCGPRGENLEKLWEISGKRGDKSEYEFLPPNTSLIWEEDAPEWKILLCKFRWVLLGAQSGGDSFMDVAQNRHVMEIIWSHLVVPADQRKL